MGRVGERRRGGVGESWGEEVVMVISVRVKYLLTVFDTVREDRREKEVKETLLFNITDHSPPHLQTATGSISN